MGFFSRPPDEWRRNLNYRSISKSRRHAARVRALKTINRVPEICVIKPPIFSMFPGPRPSTRTQIYIILLRLFNFTDRACLYDTPPFALRRLCSFKKILYDHDALNNMNIEYRISNYLPAVKSRRNFLSKSHFACKRLKYNFEHLSCIQTKSM